MNYWLFQIMYDRFPETWPRMVNLGIAAQHYPPGWGAEMRNLNYLGRMKRGDKIIAAFRKHRFAGFATLTSDLYRGGPSLYSQKESTVNEFQERFDCRWTVIPFNADPPYIDLHELKIKGLNIDLTIGLCAKKIDKKAFEAIRTGLRKAGAKSVKHPATIMPHFASDLKKPVDNEIVASRIIRDTLHTHEMKREYDYRCQICGKQVRLGTGYLYVEVHHIRPLSKPHRGKDVKSNMLVLCPNHHAMFDLGVPRFVKKRYVQIGARIYGLNLEHELDGGSIAYHNKHIHWNSDFVLRPTKSDQKD